MATPINPRLAAALTSIQSAQSLILSLLAPAWANNITDALYQLHKYCQLRDEQASGSGGAPNDFTSTT